ncbi:MAG: hypothetical protein AAFX87_21525 [Bacteroidota bacterium]
MRLINSKIIMEFVSVVFAVLLALFLNDWREKVALGKTLKAVKENIRQEVQRNDSLIQASYTYRTSLLNEIRSGQHRLFAVPVDQVPVDVYNDNQLADFFQKGLLFDQQTYFDRFFIESQGDQRALVMGESVFSISVQNDSLLATGTGNIQLRAADVSLHSWDVAQSTGTLAAMSLSQVEVLRKLNTVISNYQNTSNEAIKLIYEGKQRGIQSVLEDMLYLENQIMEINKHALSLIQ